jgi:hypothetical protein
MIKFESHITVNKPKEQAIEWLNQYEGSLEQHLKLQ